LPFTFLTTWVRAFEDFFLNFKYIFSQQIKFKFQHFAMEVPVLKAAYLFFLFFFEQTKRIPLNSFFRIATASYRNTTLSWMHQASTR
jgi:hypothetical protein